MAPDSEQGSAARGTMEFLVHIEIEWPEGMTEETREEISRRERERAAELAGEGILRRMWRIPGRRANWGLWEARDASELHDALSSLPVFPWMNIHVEPLAGHPVDPRPPAAGQEQSRPTYSARP